MSNVSKIDNIELPNISCAIKLALLVMHIEEYIDQLNHVAKEREQITIQSLLEDGEIKKYVAYINKVGLGVMKR